MPGVFEVTLKVFIVREGALLVLRDRASGQGDLPGGRIEQDELHGGWPAAVARELEEELGADAHVLVQSEPAFVFPHHIQASGRDAVGLAFRGRWIDGAITLSDEHDRYRWVDLQDPGLLDHFVTHQRAAVARFVALEGGRYLDPDGST